MNCHTYSDELVAAAATPEALPAPVVRHLALCQACSQRLQELARHARALSDLSRASAPRELEGRVVAALHAGHRQERSVARLGILGRQLPPQQLEHALAAEAAAVAADGSGGPHAPHELEQRVAAELAGEAAEFATRRALARLPRRPAPELLAERVADRLRRNPRSVSWAARHWKARGRLAAVLTAAALLLAVALQSRSGAPFQSLPSESSPAAGSATAYSFEVRYHDDFQELDATSRAWVDGITGGLTWARAK